MITISTISCAIQNARTLMMVNRCQKSHSSSLPPEDVSLVIADGLSAFQSNLSSPPSEMTTSSLASSEVADCRAEEQAIPLVPLDHQWNRTASSLRPGSILKPVGHKRSCSLGFTTNFGQGELNNALDLSTCDCREETRTKSVSILTPSQEKDENELWPSANNCPKCGRSNGYCQCCGNDQNDALNNETDVTFGGHVNLHRQSSDPATDRQSLYSVHMEKDFRYYFQHPYARLFIAYFVVFCNFLIFAEDPLSHSLMECSIPILGNVISFIGTKYPPEWEWIVVKVLMWITAVIVGLIFGKFIFHNVLLRRILRLKMFRDEQGTWMIMFLSMFISCYFFSIVYNFCLVSAHQRAHLYVINTYMGMSYANFMKVAACGTWLGDFFTAWMITDMMLQDNLYPHWARPLRNFWHHHESVRVFIFWTGAMVIAALVISLIVSDKINWDHLNQNFISTTELSRAFLASSILVMDLLMVMQDWDFPHFVCDLDIKLPGLLRASYTFNFFRQSLKFPDLVFHISGKWFNYGIIIMVMLLDLNMWKNQIIYYPVDYGQYVDQRDQRIYTVTDETLLSTGNQTLWDYKTRAFTINPLTNLTFISTDFMINSRYLGYPAFVKGMAFLPCAAGFVLFFTLIYQYGRFPPKTDASAGGRFKKRGARDSSWRRERRDSRYGGVISWPGITVYENLRNEFKKRKEEL